MYFFEIFQKTKTIYRVGGQKQPTHEWMPRKRLRQRLLWLVGTGGGGYIKAAKHRQQEMQAWHRER